MKNWVPPVSLTVIDTRLSSLESSIFSSYRTGINFEFVQERKHSKQLNHAQGAPQKLVIHRHSVARGVAMRHDPTELLAVESFRSPFVLDEPAALENKRGRMHNDRAFSDGGWVRVVIVNGGVELRGVVLLSNSNCALATNNLVPAPDRTEHDLRIDVVR